MDIPQELALEALKCQTEQAAEPGTELPGPCGRWPELRYPEHS
mgnify:CR=1 FL=1